MTSPSKPLDQLQPEERRALLARMLREKARASVKSHPLTYGQRALWYLYQIAPESSAYNLTIAVRVRHHLDLPALQRAIQNLVERHAALRTSFAITDTGLVQLVRGYEDSIIEPITATGWSDEQLHTELLALHERPFDLGQAPLMRCFVLTRSDTDHLLLISQHHIITDLWSIAILVGELQALYAAEVSGRPAGLPAPERHYPDFAHWQHEMLAGPEGQRLRDYWHRQLAGELPQLNLPTDRPRPPFQSFRGATRKIELEDELIRQLRALAQTERTTLFAVLLTAYTVLLHRYTGQHDIIVGAPMACRVRPEVQQLVGYLVNPVPLRSDLAGEPAFHELLRRTRRTLLEALDHQDYPFALLVEQLKPARDPGRTAIFEVFFNLQPVQRLASGRLARQSGEGNELLLEPVSFDQQAGQFDLMLDAIEGEDSLSLSLSYSTDLFEADTIARMAGHLQTLLAGIVADPGCQVGTLPLLTPAEQTRILHTWNATTALFPHERCLHELIAEQCARNPTTVAASFAEQHLNYAELEERANQLAWHLRACGVGPDVLVGLYLERSLDMLVALLGILKAGGAYVPLDPGFPRERLVLMLEDAAAPVLITQTTLAAQVPPYSGQVLLIDADWPTIAAQASVAPESDVQPHHLAYVIFTSGSTGRPKGVQISHRAVVNFLNAMRMHPGLTANDTLVAVTTLSFDIAVLELYLPLIVGARVVLADRVTATDGMALRVLLERSNATVMQATPVTWRLLLGAGWRPTRPFKALCGGEAFPPELARALLDAGVELWNMYGPTETTVWSAIYRVEQVDGPLPIGQPINNTQLYVLNPALALQPVGVTGELYIGGVGVARGYHQRPELTAERFIADPFSPDPAARLYRTGDLARLRPDGLVEVLGRTDYQVKIRGFRIELGEIEAALLRHPAVAEAVVVAREDGRGGQRLLAYLVPGSETPLQAGELRLHLRDSLPDYMLPAAFIPLERLPLTPNGKIDRSALPAPEAARSRGDESYVAPATPTELAVAATWREVLELDRVSVYDNFFDLGGHSLVAIEALNKLEHQLGVRLNPGLIRAQTLGQLAASYDELLRQPPAAQVSTEVPPSREQERSQPQGLAGRLFGAVKRAVSPDNKKQG